MITSRDLEIIDFLEQFKMAKTSALQGLFFPSFVTCQRRLKYLFEVGKVKRFRDLYTNEYVYYIKKTKLVKHSLLLTDFLSKLNSIENIEIGIKKSEFEIEGIRPDCLLGYQVGNKKYLSFVEVQISNVPLDIEKYEQLYRKNWKSKLKIFPRLIAITDQSVDIKHDFLKIDVIKTDLSNIESLING